MCTASFVAALLWGGLLVLMTQLAVPVRAAGYGPNSVCSQHHHASFHWVTQTVTVTETVTVTVDRNVDHSPDTQAQTPITSSISSNKPTGTGIWKSTASSTTIWITTASAGSRCGAAHGTRTVCATPTASCHSKSGATYSTCSLAPTKMSTTTSRSSAATSTTTASSSASGSWPTPTMGSSFLWSLDELIPEDQAKLVSNTGVSLKNMTVYDVDMFGVSASNVSAYKKQGKYVTCYVDVGSWESGRPDGGDFTPSCYCNKQDSCKMDGWDEWWFDLHTPSCVSNIEKVITARFQLAKSKGCDAIEPDNLDSYNNSPGWQTTIDDQFAYLKFLSDTAHSLGMGIALKNSPDMIQQRPQVVDMFDFVLIEQCAVYDECDKYQPFVTKGKPAFEVEYGSSISCTRPGFFLIAYSGDTVDYKTITNFCSKS